MSAGLGAINNQMNADKALTQQQTNFDKQFDFQKKQSEADRADRSALLKRLYPQKFGPGF